MPRKRSLNPKVLLVIVGDEVQGISSDPSQEVSSAQGWLWEGTWGWQKVTNEGFFSSMIWKAYFSLKCVLQRKHEAELAAPPALTSCSA